VCGSACQEGWHSLKNHTSLMLFLLFFVQKQQKSLCLTNNFNALLGHLQAIIIANFGVNPFKIFVVSKLLNENCSIG